MLLLIWDFQIKKKQPNQKMFPFHYYRRKRRADKKVYEVDVALQYTKVSFLGMLYV